MTKLSFIVVVVVVVVVLGVKKAEGTDVTATPREWTYDLQNKLATFCDKGNISAVKDLIQEFGFQIVIEPKHSAWSECSFRAASSGQIALLEYLFQNGLDVDEVDIYNSFNLLNHVIYVRGDIEVIRFLLRKGADVFATSDYYSHYSPLMYAIDLRLGQVVTELIAWGATVEYYDSSWFRASLAEEKIQNAIEDGKRIQSSLIEQYNCYESSCESVIKCKLLMHFNGCNCISGWRGWACYNATDCPTFPCKDIWNCNDLYMKYNCSCLPAMNNLTCSNDSIYVNELNNELDTSFTSVKNRNTEILLPSTTGPSSQLIISDKTSDFPSSLFFMLTGDYFSSPSPTMISLIPTTSLGGLYSSKQTATQSTTQSWTEPTRDPNSTMSHCNSFSIQMDAIFLVDESGSVNRNSYQEALEFVASVVDAFKIGKNEARVALITFDHNPLTVLSLVNSTRKGKQESMYVIKGAKYNGGGTSTGKAITEAVKHFEAHPRESIALTKIIIVLTDGRSGDNVAIPAAIANDKGIKVYAIGIGTNINTKQLEEIAMDLSRVYHVLSTGLLTTIKSDLEERVCEDVMGIRINCTTDSHGFPLMHVLVPRSLNFQSFLTIGTCLNKKLENFNEEYWFFSIMYNECETKLNSSDLHIIYHNVMYLSGESGSNTDSVIIRSDNQAWGLRCLYDKVMMKTISGGSFETQPKTIENKGSLLLYMALYRTSAYSEALTFPAEFYSDELVYILIQLSSIENLQIFILDCWATPSADPNHVIQYMMIKDGCILDKTLYFDSRSSFLKILFSYEAFRFRDESTKEVYIHAKVVICLKNSDSRCNQGCIENKRKRRAINNNIEALKEVSAGPLTLAEGSRTKCKDMEPIQNGHLECTKGLELTSSCQLHCLHGFYLSSSNPSNDSIICSANSDEPEWEGPTLNCIDINECAVPNNPCNQVQNSEMTECVNTLGSYKCQCLKGYRSLQGPKVCKKAYYFQGSIKSLETFFEELRIPNSKLFQQTKNEYESLLRNSFLLEIQQDAVDIEIFLFTPGSIIIHFNVFYFKEESLIYQDFLELRSKLKKGLTSRNSTDIVISSFNLDDKNECNDERDNDCSVNAKCINIIGSFSCECKMGYKDFGMKEFPGRECEKDSSENSEEKDVTQWVIFGLGIAGLLVALVIILGCVINKKCKGSKVVPEMIYNDEFQKSVSKSEEKEDQDKEFDQKENEDQQEEFEQKECLEFRDQHWNMRGPARKYV